MVRRVGIEPTTTGLKGLCSTTELPARGGIERAKNSRCGRNWEGLFGSFLVVWNWHDRWHDAKKSVFVDLDTTLVRTIDEVVLVEITRAIFGQTD